METEAEHMDYDYTKGCRIVPTTFYESSLGFQIALPEWEAVLTAVVLSLIVVVTVVGNALVVMSILQSPRLRAPQNYFLVSLAVADLTVAIIVLPLSITNYILGRWHFGLVLCKVWLTSDILCCTASILNLCAIAMDRYWAITDPINYAYHRTSKHVFYIIGGVWVTSAIISSPPLLGWNDWPSAKNWTDEVPCVLTSEQGFVVYSSLGSFFIPGFIMTVIYIEIYIATKMRLRARARAVTIRQATLANKPKAAPQVLNLPDNPQDMESNTRTSFSSALVGVQDLADLPSEVSKSNEVKKKKKGKKPKPEPVVLPVEDSVTDVPSQHDRQRDSIDTLADEPRSPMSPMSVTSVMTTASHVPRADTERPGPVYAFHDEKKRISLSKERKAARTLGIIMGVFVLCWLPFALLYVIPSSFKCDLEKTTVFCVWLGYVNSALNPIIYTIFNMDFRRAFKKILHIS